MNSRASRFRKLALSAAVATAAWAAAPALTSAQTNKAGGTGLNALSDDALLTELAARKMNGLLDHAFAVNNVPPDQRGAMLAIPAINRIGDLDNPPKLGERADLFAQVAAGADRVVSGTNDSKTLVEYSMKLIKGGIEPEANLIDYWGEAPAVQRRLAPLVDAVVKMLTKAAEIADTQCKALEKQLTSTRNERVEQQWIQADAQRTDAIYTLARLRYNEAMTRPPGATGATARKKAIEQGLEVLQKYDNAESGIQAAVRNRMAKLNMARGDWGPANDLFETVVSGKVDERTKIEPPAPPEDQYVARYFSVVCEMNQGELARADRGLKELIAWQKQAVPDPAAQENLDAAADVLRYRLLLKQRDKSKTPDQKKQYEDQALAVLAQLNEKQPALRGIIAEQLVGVMGDKVDPKTAEPLLLEALVNNAVQDSETVADDPTKASPELVNRMKRAIDAAHALMTRKDPKITPTIVSRMAIFIPLLHERLGHKVDATNAYLEYVEKKRGTDDRMKTAFDRAAYLLYDLTKDGGERKDPAISAAWDRFLPLAVDKYNHKELAYEYANRLRAKQQFSKALKYYGEVPKTDKRHDEAVYRKMLVLTDLLYEAGPDKKYKLAGAERAKIVKAALDTAKAVKEQSLALMNSAAASAEDKLHHRKRVAVVSLTEAELAASGEKPDWPHVLQSLEGYEKLSGGLDNEAALNNKVMELRVAAYIQLKQFNQAATTLIALLEKQPGERAQGMVLGVLRRLNEDYDRAIAAGDMETARELAKNRSQLSKRLVEWAQNSKDANVSKDLYLYKRFDAETQRQYGATLQGEERTTQLKRAMDAYTTLRSPESVAAYKAFVLERKKNNPQDKTDPEAPDPAVTLGMALTSYDLSDWATAATELKKLRFSGKLGVRTRTETDEKTGEQRVVPNDQYWEAMYKYYGAVNEWAKADAQNADAQAELGAVKKLLLRDYVAGPDEVGGVKWREPFEKLRKDLLPDLNLDELRQGRPATEAAPASTQTTPAATEPATAEAPAGR
jgi:hypothetical protein